MTIYYQASIYNPIIGYCDVEDGVCAPESMAAVALVHYPMQEGWAVDFWADGEGADE